MSKPKKMTPLEQIAFNVACKAPIRKSNSATCLVAWSDIIQMRAEIERMGYDWKKYAKIDKENVKRARAAWTAERHGSDNDVGRE